MTWKDVDREELANVFRVDYLIKRKRHIKPWVCIAGKVRQEWRKRYLIATGGW